MHIAVETNPDYLGLIGSKRRTSIVIDRLREAGCRGTTSKIHAPIGLDIGAVSPKKSPSPSCRNQSPTAAAAPARLSRCGGASLRT
jgi:hypothetical protein